MALPHIKCKCSDSMGSWPFLDTGGEVEERLDLIQ